MTTKLYGQEVYNDGELLHIKIKKPIYGATVSLNSKIISYAKAYNLLLSVTADNITEVVSPYTWIKEAYELKKVFKFKDRPMRLYVRSLRVDKGHLANQMALPI